VRVGGIQSALGVSRHGGTNGSGACAAERVGGGPIRPAGDGSHRAEACGPRAARPAGGDAGPDRASHAREGNSEGPHAGLCPAAGGIARGGGSEGCARCAARATAPSPRGKRIPTEWQESHTLRPGGARNNPGKGRQGPSGVQGPGRTAAVPQEPTVRPWCASHHVVAVFSYTCWCL
jgi:hypothetical protein